jgi:hypothetical protein
VRAFLLGEIMKQVAVICNNHKEWIYFMETLQWKLSKERKPYKSIHNCIVDIDANIKYIHINSGSDYTFKEQLQGRELNDYILMCGISDHQLVYLKSKVRGE